VLDELYLLTAAPYVELNPTRAGLVKAPSRYRWSSAAAHVRGRDDILVRVAPLLKSAPPWRGFLARAIPEEDIKLLRAHESTGRPLGDEEFLATLEENLGRILRRQKSGPKPRPKKSSAGKPWDQAASPELNMVSPELRKERRIVAPTESRQRRKATRSLGALMSPQSSERSRRSLVRKLPRAKGSCTDQRSPKAKWQEARCHSTLFPVSLRSALRGQVRSVGARGSRHWGDPAPILYGLPYLVSPDPRRTFRFVFPETPDQFGHTTDCNAKRRRPVNPCLRNLRRSNVISSRSRSTLQ
jgi:hypothetical protein